MEDIISKRTAIDALRAIKQGLWEIDIPSPTVPEYVEHHEQIKNMMDIVDGWINRIKEEPAVNRWIPCKERLPENANHPGKICQSYQVMTKYGVTAGWYNPDKGCWYALMWFLCGRLTEEYDRDFVRGDIPKVVKHVDVIAWMPFPESYKEEENGTDD